MLGRERILEAFRKYDTAGDGTITVEKLATVMKMLDANVFYDQKVELLVEASGLSKDGVVRYEDFIEWTMASGIDGPLPEAHPVCQAAFAGDLEALRGLVEAQGKAAALHSGYVQVDGHPAGLWTVGGLNSFQLKHLEEDPKLPPAHALHYAAFAGKADVVRFLVEECEVARDDEGDLQYEPKEIAASHRLGIDGELLDDASEVLALLEENEAPLSPSELERARSKFIAADPEAVTA
mmetsp:Transcript_104285/g.295418  ORF Transcript_104285/g.295418 Transcript_104285/m.295418 type:complete len:237 (+) Transcript_104285:67-777(+)|eukprot:CAMPEP_0179379014 /NCGR_PEP_ID=MMETSP0797-20121207/89625_1 /TAXON_ID=47934 /ORGANISM="Dinophysis acuminata, Strain DAEP01" /LENGTH=236 /DNA_ID=CAMNT_0021095089 /DNA_START=62 /DNA_END=772 /DNA_ORIENTATION=-